MITLSMTRKFILAGLLLLFAVSSAYAEKLTVAVFDFEARDEATAGLAGKMTDLVTAELSLTGDFRLVEREEIDYILAVIGQVTPKPADETRAIKAGNLVGARVLVLGRTFALDDDLVVIAKIIGTETSRVEAAVVRAPFTRALQPAARELAQKIRIIIMEKAGEFVASMKPETEIKTE